MFEEVKAGALKARQDAKDTRKKWKGSEPGAARDDAFQIAVVKLETAIDALKEWRGEQSPFRREAEGEIGDCLGVKGGTLRDWGRYQDAAIAYDEGLEYERESHRLGGQPNSYCLVQRLVCRVLHDPETFVHSRSILGLDVDHELMATAGVVRAQVKVRTDVSWAQADLALVWQLLAGRSGRGFDDAIGEWDAFDDTNPDSFAYATTLETISILQRRLDPLLDDHARRSWDELVSRLKRPRH